MGLKKMGWQGVDCIRMARDKATWRAFVNTVMNVRVP
jgi:hypothetical protein